ncbi:MAG: hypothetical protein J6U15_04755 [Lachnospiraceae bacterium]|nr:hypothetical protein [Lachnospiraceae bacterium]
MKKKLSLLLAATMLVSCLAGCGGTTESADTSSSSSESTATTASDSTEAAPSGEVSTVVILYPGEETDAMANFINNELNPRLAEKAGIQVEMLYKGWDQYWDQKGVMLAANQRIDLYWDGLPDLSSMVNASQCQPLDDLIK